VTYSLVAFDPDTGECGVAVQSHWFSVGGLVTWGEPGVGAVATQANVDPAYGPRGLARMRAGASAPEALVELLGEDAMAASRQVAMVDAHTGAECMPFSGQLLGHHHSAQANLMASDRVWGAMSEAFLAAGGSLTARLLDALDAGEAAGGDLRGRQSAAILVVPRDGEAWERVVEVRVEDHRAPLPELRRLVRLKAGYVVASEADLLVGGGDFDGAAERFLAAWELVPEGVEMRFWAGLSLVHRGEAERGAELLRGAIAEYEGWRTLLGMLTPADGPGIAESQRLLAE
jgi:uncharacterized Ntn-hydrolase superfamily protein